MNCSLFTKVPVYLYPEWKRLFAISTVKLYLNGLSPKDQKLVYKTDYRSMQVKSIADCSAILSALIKLHFVIKIFVLSIFKFTLKTGVTVYRVGSVNFIRYSPVYGHIFNK